MKRIDVRWILLLSCSVLSASPANQTQAGDFAQKGYGKSSVHGDHCRHHRMKEPPLAPVANAIAAPQTVATPWSVVNPFAAPTTIRPETLRALAEMLGDSADSPQASPRERRPAPAAQQSGKPGELEAPAVPDPYTEDAMVEIKRLDARMKKLEAGLDRLEQSTLRLLDQLQDR